MIWPESEANQIEGQQVHQAPHTLQQHLAARTWNSPATQGVVTVSAAAPAAFFLMLIAELTVSNEEQTAAVRTTHQVQARFMASRLYRCLADGASQYDPGWHCMMYIAAVQTTHLHGRPSGPTSPGSPCGPVLPALSRQLDIITGLRVVVALYGPSYSMRRPHLLLTPNTPPPAPSRCCSCLLNVRRPSRSHLGCRVRQWCLVGHLHLFRPVGPLRPSNLANLLLLHQ